MKDKLGIDSELVAGHGGVFEVSVGDKLIFSKKASGRFPDDGEVVKLLNS